MAKIDVSTIPGYEEMSVEDKIKALEGFEYDDGQATIKNLKESVSKASSQAAEWKKKHNALLSEEEQAKISREENLAAMEAELASLRKEKSVAEYTAQLTSIGYDGDLAKSTAEAFSEGDFTKIIANQKKFNESYEKQIKANLLKETPSPKIGNEEKKITKEEFSSMSYSEIVALKNENPELYSSLKS